MKICDCLKWFFLNKKLEISFSSSDVNGNYLYIFKNVNNLWYNKEKSSIKIFHWVLRLKFWDSTPALNWANKVIQYFNKYFISRTESKQQKKERTKKMKDRSNIFSLSYQNFEPLQRKICAICSRIVCLWKKLMPLSNIIELFPDFIFSSILSIN
jgi:hypothetical protein